MQQIYKKYLTNVVIIWAACFVGIFFVYLIFLRPQLKIKHKLEKQLSEQKQVYEAAQLAAQPETRKKLNIELEELQDKLEQFVIDSDSSGNLTFDISQIANEKHVSSFSIRTRNNNKTYEIPNSDHLTESRIDISFQGGFPQFASFLNTLERHRPVVFVDTFSITRTPRNSMGHEVNMGLSVFVKKRQDS